MGPEHWKDHGRMEPTKAAFLQRIADEGRSRQFKKDRDELKKRYGIPPSEGWRVAGAMFPPLSGGPMEYPPTEDTLAWIKQLQIDNPWKTESVAEAEKNAKTAAADAYIPVETSIESKSKKLVRAAATFEALARLVPVGREASELDIVRWVFDNYKTPVEKIDADLVPSLGALGYLEHVKSKAEHYTAFIANAWVKLLPNKQTLEYEQSLKDDGRQELGMVDEFIRSLKVVDGAA